MHREEGQDTTESTHSWMGRAYHDIENYGPRRGMVRRPDLVIVDDPCLAPTQDNIERVVEIKFKDDKRSVQQFSGAEDVVLVDMASKLKPGISVFCLDTGRLHPETYRFIEKVRERYDIHPLSQCSGGPCRNGGA